MEHNAMVEESRKYVCLTATTHTEMTWTEIHVPDGTMTIYETICLSYDSSDLE